MLIFAPPPPPPSTHPPHLSTWRGLAGIYGGCPGWCTGSVGLEGRWVCRRTSGPVRSFGRLFGQAGGKLYRFIRVFRLLCSPEQHHWLHFQVVCHALYHAPFELSTGSRDAVAIATASCKALTVLADCFLHIHKPNTVIFPVSRCQMWTLKIWKKKALT